MISFFIFFSFDPISQLVFILPLQILDYLLLFLNTFSFSRMFLLFQLLLFFLPDFRQVHFLNHISNSFFDFLVIGSQKLFKWIIIFDFFMIPFFLFQLCPFFNEYFSLLSSFQLQLFATNLKSWIILTFMLFNILRLLKTPSIDSNSTEPKLIGWSFSFFALFH